MKPPTPSIIEELGKLVPVKNKHTVIEARAQHVITSAAHLIEMIHTNYGPELAEDLTKRLIRSILVGESQKFTRKMSQIRKQEQQNGKK